MTCRHSSPILNTLIAHLYMVVDSFELRLYKKIITVGRSSSILVFPMYQRFLTFYHTIVHSRKYTKDSLTSALLRCS